MVENIEVYAGDQLPYELDNLVVVATILIIRMIFDIYIIYIIFHYNQNIRISHAFLLLYLYVILTIASAFLVDQTTKAMWSGSPEEATRLIRSDFIFL